MKVLNELETMRRCVQGASLTRFNDGELGYAHRGWGHRLEGLNGALAHRLRETFIADLPGLLIGVPRIFPPDDDSLPVSTAGCKRFWPGWRGFCTKLFDADRTYGSGFVSYPDRHLPPEQWPAFIGLCYGLWGQRDTVLVGSKQDCIEGTRGIEAIKGTKSLEFVEVPPKGAWSTYDATLATLVEFPAKTLMLVATGVSGTVLAHDLHVAGYQAVDIGRLPLRMRLYLGIDK